MIYLALRRTVKN